MSIFFFRRMGNAGSADNNRAGTEGETGGAITTANVGANAVPGIATGDDAQDAAENQVQQTEEEAKFTQIYSLGGTRFEVDKQKYLFGDSSDLKLLCRQSYSFYRSQHQAVTNKKSTTTDDHNNLVQIPYSSNDQQVIATPIHLLINVRRASVRLVQTKVAPGKAQNAKLDPNNPLHAAVLEADKRIQHRLEFVYDSLRD